MEVPEEVLSHPLMNEDAWVALRDAHIRPLVETGLVTTERDRTEFLVGAWLLNRLPAEGLLLDQIQPQMLRVVDMLAAGHQDNAVFQPRRTSKTTALFCVLLGRCYLRDRYKVAYTMLLTLKKTQDRFMEDIYSPIALQWPDDHTRPVHLFKGNGKERIEFPNGSLFAILSPDGDAIRSGAYDAILLDEAGAWTAERWVPLMAAIMPTFDTRPGNPQLILAGTAGKFRGGSEFWNTLNNPRAGVIRYSVPDDIDPEELTAWVPDEEHPKGRVRDLTLAVHPGLYGLTTLERMETNFYRQGAATYAEEYLGLFGSEGSNVALIPQSRWLGAALPLDEAGTVAPKRFSLVAVVSPNATYAAVGAAWVGRDKRVHVALLHHQAGVDGFGKRLLELSKRHKKAITYDGGSNTTSVEIAQLRESRPRPVERVLVTRDIGKAAVTLVNLLNQDRLRHHDQRELNAAVEIAVKRAIGTYGAWGFGGPRGVEDYDIVGLEAVAMAAYVLDQEKSPTSAVDIGFFE